MLVIVAMVTKPNAAVTIKSAEKLVFTAGYIKVGINGSQGPKTKMVNNIHGVMFVALGSLWIWECPRRFE